MKIWIYKRESIVSGDEIEIKVVPCISKEIAKSYFDFDKEETSKTDNEI